jgi:predicted nucleotidyltransferase
MTFRFGLDTETIQAINTVFNKFPAIKSVVIYGSRATGNFQNGSDIDITLKGANLDLNLLQEVYLQLDSLLLPYSFDISLFHQIENLELKDHINRVGKVLHTKKKELNAYSNMER